MWSDRPSTDRHRKSHTQNVSIPSYVVIASTGAIGSTNSEDQQWSKTAMFVYLMPGTSACSVQSVSTGRLQSRESWHGVLLRSLQGKQNTGSECVGWCKITKWASCYKYKSDSLHVLKCLVWNTSKRKVQEDLKMYPVTLAWSLALALKLAEDQEAT